MEPQPSPAAAAAAAASDFEFNTVAAGDVKGADDLFFKGQLLPLALPPRMQMVHTLSLLQAQAETKREIEEAAIWPRDGGCPCGDRSCGLRERGRRCPGVPMRALLPQVFLAEKNSARDSAWCSRSFWGDSSSQPSDSSCADSSSESRDSSGSSKDSVDLSGEKGELAGSANAGQHKFFHNLVAFGNRTGAQQQLQLHGRNGHARMFSWLKPASSRWNGIFGGGKKGAGSGKKVEMEEEVAASAAAAGSADSRVVGFLPRAGSPARDSSSSDDVPAPRLRHSGPISVCDDEFLGCKERLSGPLSYKDSFQCDWEGLRASVRTQNLAEEKREWQSVHCSFREDREVCQPDPRGGSSSSLGDGAYSGREPWSNGASFRDSSRGNSREPVEKRGSDVAEKGRRRSLAMESGGRQGYLEKLFRSLHVRSRSTVPLKTGGGDFASKSKGSLSSRRGSAGALPLLNPISSTSTEVQSSIQGAIAYCKKSQSGCKGAPVVGDRQV